MKAVADAYKDKMLVWVEDVLTREILTRLWSDPRFAVQVAHGSSSVKALVYAVTPGYQRRIFGVVDSDWVTSDPTPEWQVPGCRVFRLPVHEAENVVLDFGVLTTLAPSITAAQLEATAKAEANNWVWRGACRATLDELRLVVPGPWPSDEDLLPASNLNTSKRLLRDLPLWQRIPRELNSWHQSELEQRLTFHGDALKASLEDGSWVRRMPGKQMVRDLRAKFPALNRSKPNATPQERDLDVGKKVADALRKDPPKWATDLKAILLDRSQA